MRVSNLKILSAEKSGASARFTLEINGEVKKYDAPFQSPTPTLRGFDFPVEVRQLLRQDAGASRSLVRLLLGVMDNEKITFPQILTTASRAEEERTPLRAA